MMYEYQQYNVYMYTYVEKRGIFAKKKDDLEGIYVYSNFFKLDEFQLYIYFFFVKRIKSLEISLKFSFIKIISVIKAYLNSNHAWLNVYSFNIFLKITFLGG